MVQLHVDKQGKATIVLDQNISSQAVTDMHEALDEAIAKSAKHLVLDMKAVHYINSTGLGVLLGTKSKLEGLEGDLKVINVHDDLLDFFQSVNLDTVFDIEKAGPS